MGHNIIKGITHLAYALEYWLHNIIQSIDHHKTGKLAHYEVVNNSKYSLRPIYSLLLLVEILPNIYIYIYILFYSLFDIYSSYNLRYK